MMLFLLGLYGLGAMEQVKEQISCFAEQTTADSMAEDNIPAHTSSYLAHRSCLIPFAEEAAGLIARRCRESVKRAASSSRDVRMRMQWLLFFLVLTILAMLCASIYFSLPGIFVRSSSIRIVSYLHDQDGLK